MPKKKTTTVYYNNKYYRRRYWNRRYKYINGTQSYVRIKLDNTGQLYFPADAGQPQIEINNNVHRSWSLQQLLAINAAYSNYKIMYSERKLRGIRYEIYPSNNQTVATPNTVVVGYTKNSTSTFAYLQETNSSLAVSVDGRVKKYVPITSTWQTSSTADAIPNDGWLSVGSLVNASLTTYPRVYTIKISLYIIMRNIVV